MNTSGTPGTEETQGIYRLSALQSLINTVRLIHDVRRLL